MKPLSKLNLKNMDEESFTFTSSYGTEFTGDRCDLRAGVDVLCDDEEPSPQLMTCAAEFAAWHRANVFNTLSTFDGYDCIRWDIQVRA